MLEKIKELQDLGYVRLNRHSVHSLWIANYTPKAQYEQAFREYPLLLSCRGLILDDAGTIVGRGFTKFFNYEEHQPADLPIGTSDIEITEKMDGSLLIVFRYKGQVFYATRGSFTSDQAKAGAILFRKLYQEEWIAEGNSYLFEYIGPDNRIVVSYETEALIHLACLDTATGKDLERDTQFKVVNSVVVQGSMFGDLLYQELKQRNLSNREGYIIRISNPDDIDFRCKIKFEEYCVLHKIVTGISTKVIWEYLRDGRSFDDLLERTPDEFNNFVRATVKSLKEQFVEIEQEVAGIVQSVKDLPSRKEQALYILANHSKLSGIVFKMLDAGDYRTPIWKKIEPEYRQPFADRADG